MAIWISQVAGGGGGGGGGSAAATTFTPAGNISATNVQSAIQELDAEKLNYAFGTLSSRPASYITNTLYVVSGDATASNNGRSFLYNTLASAWVELDTTVANRKINELSDVDTATTVPVADDILKFNGTNWIPGQSVVATSGDLASRPASLSGGGIYVVDGDTDTTNNGRTFIYDTGLNMWLEVSGNRDILAGTLANRPITSAKNMIYVVYGDPTASNNGKAFVYDTVVAGWVDIAGADVISDYTYEPTGFPVDPTTGEINRTSSAISFTNSTRTFTISPTGTEFIYLFKNSIVTVTSAKTVVIPNTTGNHYIYFDSTGTLMSTTTFSPALITSNVYVASVYWNAVDSVAVLVGDERHGSVMDGSTHAYLHTTIGSKYVGGMALGSFAVDQDGTSDAHAQFSIEAGTFRDEDILHSLSAVPATTPIPVFYRLGQAWHSVTGSFNYKLGSGNRVQYNSVSGGNYALTEATDGQYVLTHIVATNDPTRPYIALMGLNAYANRNAARLGANSELASYTGLLFHEFVFVGTVIYQTDATYTSTAKAKVVSTDAGESYVDFRNYFTVNPTLALQNYATIPYVDGHFAGTAGVGVTDYNKSPKLDATGKLDKTFLQNYALSVNGVTADSNGDVTVAIAKVDTGTLASRPAAGATGLDNGDIYIVSGDAVPSNNGRTFIYKLADASWYEINALGAPGVSDVKIVSYLGSDSVGTGTWNAPYKTIQYAINQTAFGAATVIVVVPGTYAENIVISSHLNLTILGFTSIVTTAPIQIVGSVTLNGTSTRIRIKDLQIDGTALNPVPLVIDGSVGRHIFENVQFNPYTTSNCITFSGTPQNFFTIVDCGFGSTGVVNLGTTTNTAQCYFIRPRNLYGLTIPGIWGGISVNDCDYLGVIHAASPLGLFNCRQIVAFTSTATSANGALYVHDSSTYVAASNSYTVVNKSGNAPYRFANFEIARSGNTINGVELDTANKNRYIKFRELSDVDLVTSTPKSDNLLQFNGTNWVNISDHLGYKSELFKYAISNPTFPSSAVFAGTNRTASSEATLNSAIAASATGDTITLSANITIAATVTINKSIKIIGAGFIIQTAGAGTDPVTMLSVTADNVMLDSGLTIKHLKTTNTSVETAVSVNAAGFVSNANIEFMEFGYVLRGSFSIGGTTKYTGALANNHRHIAIYKISAPSQVNGVIYDFPSEATPRASFIYLSSASGTDVFDEVLKVSNTSQLNPSYVQRQFFLQDAFVKTTGKKHKLWFDNNKWDDLNGGIGLLGTSGAQVLDNFEYIAVYNNTQGSGAISTNVYKGLVYLDGSGALHNLGATNWYYAKNSHPVPLRSTYTSAYDNGGIAYNNAVYNAYTAPLVSDSLTYASALANLAITNAAGASSLSQLTDVDVTTSSPASGQELRYNGTKWVPGQGFIGKTSSTPPAFNTIVPGTIWIDSDTLEQYIYVIDASATNVWVSLGKPGVTTIAGLSDVDLTTNAPTSGQVLRYNGSTWVPYTPAAGASTLSALTDVTIATPTDSQILRYSSASSKWVNVSQPSGNTYRNKLINGNMRVCQRSDTSTSISFSAISNTNKYYLADRWYYKQNRTETYFNCSANLYGNYFRDYTGVVTGHCSMIANTSTFIYPDMVYGLFQDIEAKDTEEFNLGISAYAKPMVLSFWANVNGAGTYPVSVNIGTTHSFVSSYTITSNTAGSINNWQYFEIPIPPFTLTTVPFTGTTYPMKVSFGGSIGSNFRTSTANQWVAGEFYAPTSAGNLSANKTLLVGAVQLEVGTVATPFELLDTSLQLRRCQRYYWTLNTASSGSPGWFGEMGSITFSTTNALIRVTHPEPMRVAPTVTTAGTITVKDGNGWSSTATYVAGGSDHRTNSSEVFFSLATAGTLFRPVFFITNSNSGRINFSADD